MQVGLACGRWAQAADGLVFSDSVAAVDTSAEARPTLTRDPAASVPPLDPLVPLGSSCKSLAQQSYCAAVRWPAAWRYEMSGIMEARTLSRLGATTLSSTEAPSHRGRVCGMPISSPSRATRRSAAGLKCRQAWAMMMAHTVLLFSV